MNQVRTVILDNEPIQALSDAAHRKHRRTMAVIEAVAARNLRRSGSVRLLVPTAVRVEAGWDRRVPRAAVLNRLRIGDADIDDRTGDLAAACRTALGVSVADAHIAAVLETTAAPHAVVTSDANDVGRVAGHLGLSVNVVRI